ncbi:FAD-binding oxidoreductase [Minwuia thermotolerans]|uniref:Hydroxyacid dehydrogenase n=1 Tax=Minwuia thermotolerans TaxID=2056226 RepID=A0A2M9FWD0_9PROT|nr:FAD-binding oxidoreductase [Minwuia thermotolerans]PJK27762.1 hydroxyacid dehydrogenase [Minwuia thermotolerans]
MNEIARGTIERLIAVVGPQGAITDPDDMAPYLVEWRDKWRGKSALVLRPSSTAEVAEIVRICAETGTAIVPQGGNTGLVGGSIPFEGGDEIVLSLGRMNRVRAVDPLNDTITVEAGCVLADVQAAADEAGRLFPMRIASEGTCQIGGNLSTNAGGTAVLRYGNMRDLVLGLEVVLPDGRVWNGLRGLRKDNTGYDLKHLFIGAEGTLGVITAAVLKLYPRPADRQVAFAAIPNPEAAVELLSLAKDVSGGQVTGFEILPRLGLELVMKSLPDARDPFGDLHPWYVLIEMSSGEGGGALREAMETALARGYEKELVADATIAESEAQAQQLWALREGLSESQKLAGGSIKHDVSIPVPKMPAFIARADRALEEVIPGFRSLAFGHIGDGNVHYNPLQPEGADAEAYLARWQEVADVVHGIVHEMGGSISAEHGLGRLKRDEVRRYKSEVELELMASIKRMLDPDNIMNPGKVISP